MTTPTSPEPVAWKLVPVEPTEAMCRAAVWALDRAREKDGKLQDARPYLPQEKYAIRYRAMLAAAPAPPVPGGLELETSDEERRLMLSDALPDGEIAPLLRDISRLQAALAGARGALGDCIEAMKRDEPSEGWREVIEAGERALIPEPVSAPPEAGEERGKIDATAITTALRHTLNFHGFDAKLHTPDWQLADQLGPELVKYLRGETDVQAIERGDHLTPEDDNG